MISSDKVFPEFSPSTALRGYMERDGLSETSLSSLSGMTLDKISGMAQGKISIDDDSARKFAAIFSTSPAMFFIRR